MVGLKLATEKIDLIMFDIKPSDIKNWDIVRHEPNYKLSSSTQALRDPNVYGYYYDEQTDKWHPHRKPTIPEILSNKFK